MERDEGSTNIRKPFKHWGIANFLLCRTNMTTTQNASNIGGNCRILASSHPHNDHTNALKGGRIADFVRCQIHITISFSSNSPTKHMVKQPNRYVGFPHNDFDFDEFFKETYGQTTKSLCGLDFQEENYCSFLNYNST